MNYKENFKESKGITLISLIITIIILIILAVISIQYIFSGKILQVATDGAGNYAKEQKNEENIFNDTIQYIDVLTNNKPNIKLLNNSERTDSTMKITAMATDEDKENLTYKLYLGTTRENLVEVSEVKENIEEGIEVSWTVPVKDTTTIYYYKIIVSDRYSNIDSGIRETNNAPKITATVTKDIMVAENPLDSKSWIQIDTNITDTENDKLDVKIYFGTVESEKLGENDLIRTRIRNRFTELLFLRENLRLR
ncbi:MAG: hypothetical protein HFJ54_03005 [Clostridia bacterium]|nr:hypothetical protein [Clostridia bacterium]